MPPLGAAVLPWLDGQAVYAPCGLESPAKSAGGHLPAPSALFSLPRLQLGDPERNMHQQQYVRLPDVLCVRELLLDRLLRLLQERETLGGAERTDGWSPAW